MKWVPGDESTSADVANLSYRFEPLEPGTSVYAELWVSDYGGNGDFASVLETVPEDRGAPEAIEVCRNDAFGYGSRHQRDGSCGTIRRMSWTVRSSAWCRWKASTCSAPTSRRRSPCACWTGLTSPRQRYEGDVGVPIVAYLVRLPAGGGLAITGWGDRAVQFRAADLAAETFAFTP